MTLPVAAELCTFSTTNSPCTPATWLSRSSMCTSQCEQRRLPGQWTFRVHLQQARVVSGINLKTVLDGMNMAEVLLPLLSLRQQGPVKHLQMSVRQNPGYARDNMKFCCRCPVTRVVVSTSLSTPKYKGNVLKTTHFEVLRSLKVLKSNKLHVWKYYLCALKSTKSAFTLLSNIDSLTGNRD